MATCTNCGSQITEGKKFCGTCGTQVNNAETGQSYQDSTGYTEATYTAEPESSTQSQSNGFDSFKEFASNAKDFTNEYDPQDIEKNKVYGGLAYILFFLPLIVCPESKYGKFHSNQGLIYLILCIANSVVCTIISSILNGISNGGLYFLSAIIITLLWLIVLAEGVFGLVNGFTGKAKELPVIGQFRIIK